MLTGRLFKMHILRCTYRLWEPEALEVAPRNLGFKHPSDVSEAHSSLRGTVLEKEKMKSKYYFRNCELMLL